MQARYIIRNLSAAVEQGAATYQDLMDAFEIPEDRCGCVVIGSFISFPSDAPVRGMPRVEHFTLGDGWWDWTVDGVETKAAGTGAETFHEFFPRLLPCLPREPNHAADAAFGAGALLQGVLTGMEFATGAKPPC